MLFRDEVAKTLTSGVPPLLYDIPRTANEKELQKIGAYPLDYKFEDKKKLHWLVGMSVPPVMTAQIAYQIYKQWLSKINK
jgi:DNA (cytosine-5)-methyltransferase 1